MFPSTSFDVCRIIHFRYSNFLVHSFQPVNSILLDIGPAEFLSLDSPAHPLSAAWYGTVSCCFRCCPPRNSIPTGIPPSGGNDRANGAEIAEKFVGHANRVGFDRSIMICHMLEWVRDIRWNRQRSAKAPATPASRVSRDAGAVPATASSGTATGPRSP